MNRAIAYILVDGEVGPHDLVAKVLDSKKRELVEQAANLGLELAAVYADVRREIEGNRLGLKAMLEAVQKQTLRSVVVDSFSSFADPQRQMLQTFECLLRHDVKIFILDENKTLERDQIGYIVKALQMANGFDKKLSAIRIKRGLQHASLSGKPIGRRPFEKHENNSEIFTNILEMRKRGLSLRDICKALNSAGVKTSSHRSWHPTTVKRMLERALNENSNDMSLVNCPK